MFKRTSGFLVLVWLVVGIILAVIEDYLTVDILERFGSALLAVVLWPLLLLGIDLRIG